MCELGWIALHRKITENDLLWDSSFEPFSRGQAWIDLIMLANHEGRDVVISFNKIHVDRGQHLTSVRKLGERWNWGNGKVLKFFRALEKEGMITRDTTQGGTLLTIVNYSEYQDVKNTNGTLMEQTRNADGTELERTSSTNNNDNNYNNENNDNNENNKGILNVSASETVPPVEKPDFPSQTVTAKKPTAYEQGVEVLEKQMSRTMLSPVVKDELRKYLLYRKQIKKVISATITINNLVAKVEEVAMKYGDTLVLEQFEKTFQNGWQGVFLAENDLKRTVNENRAGKRYSGGQPTYDWSKL